MKSNFYLYQSGILRRQDDSIVFETKDNKHYLPIQQIDHLFVFGQVEFNQNVMKLLFEYGICIFLFTYQGKFLGKFLPYQEKLGEHLIRQVQFTTDENARIKVARLILKGSVGNMLFVLKYYEKKGRIEEKVIQLIEDLIESINDSQSVEALRMIEAQVKKIYYACFDMILLSNLFRFEQRSTYPPKNEVNAMMSFGYALLYSRLESTLHRSRLCVELPFVHGHSQKGSGLQHDIADIFKPIFVDRVIFRMINKKQLDLKSDFESQKGGVYLSKDGMTKFIYEFDQVLLDTIKIGERTYSFRQILSREVHNISRHVHEGKPYVPFVLTRW